MATAEAAPAPDGSLPTCVVLGGLGFVGRFLVSRLLKSHSWIVRIADSAAPLPPTHPDRDPVLTEAVRTGRASYSPVDVREMQQLRGVISGSSVVFYIDPANSDTTRDFYSQYMLIVQGAKNVINACQECKVERLIYNSSADVVFDGIHSVQNGNEPLPYPWKFEDMFNELKAQAETLILFSNGSKGVLTCALRPSNPFGPGDTYLLPFLLGEASSGRMKFIVGNGENMSDFTYVENVAYAHVCAEQALHSASDLVAGKAFFITNKEPVKVWEFFSLLLEGLGYGRPKICLPAELVHFIVVLLNWVNGKLNLHEIAHPLLNPSVVRALSCTRTFDCSRAQKYIGYTPIVTLEDGIALTVESSYHLTEDSPYRRYRDFAQLSKAYKVLGGGKVADILLWRDEKKTFSCVLVLFTLFYWFVLSGRSLVSSSARLILLLLISLFVHNILPSSISQICTQVVRNVLGSDGVEMSWHNLQVTEPVAKDIFVSLAFIWNNGFVHAARLLAQGEDLNFFLKVSFSLYLLKWLLSLSLSRLIGLCLTCMFIIFFVYEQHEEQFDRLGRFALAKSVRLMRSLIRRLPLSLKGLLQKTHMLSCDDGSRKYG